MRLINADALENKIEESWHALQMMDNTQNADLVMEGLYIAEQHLKKQPTVEAEPVRHAHWIWKGDEGDSRFMCSACGGKENAPTCMGVPDIWEYCPNCGARMEEYMNWIEERRKQ